MKNPNTITSPFKPQRENAKFTIAISKYNNDTNKNLEYITLCLNVLLDIPMYIEIKINMITITEQKNRTPDRLPSWKQLNQFSTLSVF